jgi:hypothetical protein
MRCRDLHILLEGYDAVACIRAPFAIGSFEDAVRWIKQGRGISLPHYLHPGS